jgi:transcriptional regulator with PAS, ATPase and Fis domain
LTQVVQASAIENAPSRHSIDDVDTVVFGRGSRSAIRDEADGLRRLVLRIPDPFMSTEHGRLLRAHGKWIVEDPRSKNGVVVAGRSTRVAPIEVGVVLEVGHTVFLVERVTVASDAPLDRELASSQLASFDADLVSAAADIERVAPSTIPVLLYGETGTGKEVYANAIHGASKRRGPFVPVNCGALSASLLEAELFGHKRGAFTGATADRPGFVRSADGGTLFLDEITELSAAGQVALLRVLQEGEVVPVGDTRGAAVDVRVCAASQQPLLQAVEEGRFRSDLYARLLGYELGLPSLRERIGDLGHLVASLLPRHATRPMTVAPAAVRAMISYDWPRNIRELDRCLATAVVLAKGDMIDVAHLPAPVRAASAGRMPPAPVDALDPETDALRAELTAKLAEHAGNVSAVARAMAKHREQVQRWIKRFGLDVEGFRRGK